ncbi:MAG TPA: SAM-dependent methyltransferase, partial [Beijerinckiaceae bacterium]|nr:SAM-dependent methyltransferase [Beijerinckiaceae bacterium]
TERKHARRVQFVTGHDRHGRLPSDLDLAALADPKATTCLYMAGRTAEDLARHLVGEGLPPTTAAVVMTNVSRRDEATLRVTVGDLAAGTALPGHGPVMVMIGAAMAQPNLPQPRHHPAARLRGEPYFLEA